MDRLWTLWIACCLETWLCDNLLQRCAATGPKTWRRHSGGIERELRAGE